MGIESIIY